MFVTHGRSRNHTTFSRAVGSKILVTTLRQNGSAPYLCEVRYADLSTSSQDSGLKEGIYDDGARTDHRVRGAINTG